jgi:hypothetical protein
MTKAKGRPKIVVSERAVVARVNRKLGGEGECIRKHRSGQWAGQYYQLNVGRNWIVTEHFNLEPFARRLGVLNEWEVLSDE